MPGGQRLAEAMRRRGRRRRLLLLALVAACSASVAYACDDTYALRRLELDSVDARFSIRGAQAPHDDLVVVVDDRTFDACNACSGRSPAAATRG